MGRRLDPPARLSRRSGARLRRASRRLAAGVLLLFAGAFYFTREPAPQVLMRWRDGVTAERRADIERRFGLVRPIDPPGRAMTYELLDARPENIRELLEQPDVAGSGYIDERSFTVSAEALAGRGWTWIAERLVVSPELRVYRVIPLVILACLLVIAYSVAADLASRRKRIRRRLALLARPSRPRARVAGPDAPADRERSL